MYFGDHTGWGRIAILVTERGSTVTVTVGLDADDCEIELPVHSARYPNGELYGYIEDLEQEVEADCSLYEAAQNSESDWRPTHTLPEDFYALGA